MRRELLGVAILILVALGFAFVLQGGGLLHPEAAFYIPLYLKPTPLLAKLFDPDLFDAGMYQARELSYFFDWLDAHFLLWCIRHRLLYFFSIVHVGALLAAGMVHWICARRHWRTLDALTLGLLLALWLSSPMVMNSGHLFRSGKALTALAVIMLGWLLVSTLSRDTTPGRTRLALLALAGIFASWIDRQGYALVWFGVATCVAHALLVRRASWKPALVLLGVAGLAHAYNVWLAPAIIHALNGYYPKFDYQSVDPALVLSRAGLTNGATTLLDDVGYQFGSVPRTAAAMLLLVGLVVLARGPGRQRRTGTEASFPAVVFVGAVLFVVLLNSIMIARHPPLMFPDIHRYYYWLPVSAALAFGSTAIVAMLITHRTRPWIAFLLATVLLSNLLSIRSHWAIMQEGHLREFMVMMPALKRCLTDVTFDVDAQPGFGAYAWFCAHMRQPPAAGTAAP